MSVKDSVLSTLQKNRGNYVSGESISGDLGVSRAAVWKAIKSLRDEGYRIDAVTNRGYSLVDGSGGVSADEIRSFMPARYKGNGIFVYDIVDSTNIKARQIADGSAGDETAGSSIGGTASAADSKRSAVSPADLHGTIVVARQQTAGRGRLGRSFFSPSDGVYMSVIIKPSFDLSKSTLVTVAAAAAVAEAVDEVCGRTEETEIKWVNDIYLKGKKICGILTEGISDFESGRIESLIVGIGVNTTTESFPKELKDIAGAVEGDWSRSELIAGIATRLLDNVSRIQPASDEAGIAAHSDPDVARPFLETYRNKSMLTGQDVLVYRGTYREDPSKELGGVPARVKGIDDDGGLMVVYEDGSEETLTTGEVSIRAK